MPTLDWIGKKAVVNHHREVPYRLIHCNGKLSAGDPEAGNLLVQGDNLEALKALLPYYAGKVKCIYIDPPYNTGAQDWIYNDNVNSPQIKSWIGKVVGKESEDLSRHDKWLCMIYPRLRLLREFLSTDGVLFVSIDDTEVADLRLVLDSIFGANSLIGQFVWKSRQNKDNRNTTNASIDHEYVLCYGVEVRGDDRKTEQFSNPDNDPRGPWTSGNMVGLASKESRPNLHFDLIDEETGINYGCPEMGWRYDSSRMKSLAAEKRILWPPSPEGRPRIKNYLYEMKNKFTGFSSVIGEGIFTRTGTRQIEEIFGRRVFPFPKPSQLIAQLLIQGASKDSIILDSFSGSGTTGHAVLDLNKQDGGNRKFILVELEEKVAQDIAAERLRRVIEGYDKSKRGGETESVEGLGGGFRYCHLGTALFDEFGDVSAEVTFPDLAAHVFFSEIGVPIPKKAKPGEAYLGAHQGKAVYLLFSQADMGAAQPAVGNVLTPNVLAELTPPPEGFEGVRVVFAEGCTVSLERLKAQGILFKQIPYQVEGA